MMTALPDDLATLRDSLHRLVNLVAGCRAPKSYPTSVLHMAFSDAGDQALTVLEAANAIPSALNHAEAAYAAVSDEVDLRGSACKAALQFGRDLHFSIRTFGNGERLQSGEWMPIRTEDAADLRAAIVWEGRNDTTVDALLYGDSTRWNPREFATLKSQIDEQIRQTARDRTIGKAGAGDVQTDGSFVEANKLDWQSRFDNWRKCKAWLESHPTQVPSYVNGKRRMVDAAAWTRYWNQQDKKTFDAIDSEPEAITTVDPNAINRFADNAKARLDKIRQKKTRNAKPK